MSEIEMNSGKLQQHGRVISDQLSCNKASGRIRNGNVMELGPVSVRSQMVKDVLGGGGGGGGWGGNKFSLKELEVAANGHSKQNLIDKGDYGVVYHGILSDNTCAAVKRLVSDRFQVEDFTAAIVRHKNLDKLLRYRIERVYRLDYLHEDIEPKILRRSLISSNVLLDHQWDPKVSDFGLAKLYSPEWGINTMESLRYIAPEYASTGDFTEKSDIYSFGVLVMEIITGRSPTDRSLSMSS
ncbi:probable serine/threonine-protein kinase At1g01540 [Pyrus communis]|uniref:probable serine/threonine-protein kinase At1g01540 n=1 Tax=Pyrus communis TaxID=23211 RepID=UPI0035BEBCDB